ncbi:hypothetical protein [Sphingobacterium yanglingense]|uniref:CCDC81-like prokaryotic HU domain-containing protein n=1 Tax=Sphingobacterium yanglingense TaxID=1437280 RepID=A0A4R6WD33_9SPHI|nr:hypothetical protein [Sphingobacterium yanglingense]TDQ75689.1 hypothetical protein CLV99_3382 [Sphingobacterium yanglingense]
MNLGRQIHILLKRQSSVYINGLGTFRRVHTAATFDAKRHVYLPPISFVEFDGSATEGYDFVTYVQQANQLERHEAESQVTQAVSEVVERLTQSGQTRLDNLGDLVSYGNSYVFKPLDLSGFSYTAVSDQFHVEEAVPPTATTEPIRGVQEEVTPIEESVPEEEPLEEVPAISTENRIEEVPVPVETAVAAEQDTILEDGEFEFPDEQKSTSAYVYIIVAIVAVALLGGLYYYSTYMQEGKMGSGTIEEVIVPMDSIPKDTVATQPLADSLAVPQDTLVSSPEPEKVEEEVAPPANHRYTIVIGTHRTLALAYEEAEAFHKDGHKSVRVMTPNLAKNLKRVVWDTYATKEERDSALNYVRKHIKTDAWPDIIK